MTYKIKCYLLIYIILFNNITVCAYGIVPSDATETKVYESRNNKTPIIEIAEPNDKGVSLNKYEDYNVDQRNLVINNSVSPVISKFAGAIDKNSNFNSGIEAEIIVNEVVSDKITELNGYTEIAGKKAELIIANPNGIITKEAGFINTSRLSLIVGRNTDIDKLEFEIDKKNELIVENDLDLAKVDSVTLIARIVKLRKEITAKSLRVQTGNNKATKLNNGEYDVTSRENISDKPTLSIDVSAFANIQAGKIYIVSTEEGVGVRMDSNLTTNVDDIIFETKGDIEINKDIVSENNVSMKTTKKLNNRGAIIAKNKNIEIEANAAENNNALMYAKSGDISITSKRLDNLQKSDIKTANGNIKLRVDTLNNIGTRNQEIREGEGYSVSRMVPTGHRGEGATTKEDRVNVNLTHSPSNITANGNIEIISNTVTNRDSNITASKDINITADTLNNNRESFVVRGLSREFLIRKYERRNYPRFLGIQIRMFFGKRTGELVPVDEPHTELIPPQTHHSNTPSLIAAGRNIKLNVKKKLGQDDDIKNKTNYSPIETNRPLPDLNNNHFIIKSRDPSYMFEIRPEFLDLSVFEARKNYETEIELPEDVVFLGDSFVENEYIKDQLELQKETNKTILTNQNQLNSRIQELILNGIEYARLHKDQISYQLNEKQIKELEKDMIHYERRIINDIEVLVPRIYYASIDRAFESLIKAENELEINGETEIVNSGNLEGNNISVSTTGNFINKAGTIRSNKNIKIKSKNIVNRSITNRYGNNNNNITEEFVGEGIIQSDNGNITLESDNNIINIGSTIDSKTGELKLIAGDGISITTQQLHNKVDQGEIYKRETLTNISSNVFTKDLVIKSKKDTSIIGSNINVSNNANIESKTLTISSAENLTYEHTKKEEYSFWKGSKTTTTDTTIVTNLKSNLNIGNNLTINTEQDTNIIGSNINVKKDININTENGDVNIIGVKDRIDETIDTDTTSNTEFLSISWKGIDIGTKTTIENDTTKYHNESIVSSDIVSGGNIKVLAKNKNISIIGSNIVTTTKGNIELDAMNDINILSMEELNTVDRSIDTAVLTSTLHIGNVFADIVDNVASYHDVKDKDAVSGTTIAVNNTLGLLSNLASAPKSLSTFGFYASVNSNIDVTSIRQNTKDVINKESNIISNNGNITIKSRNNDITQKGSNIVASNDIEYIANNNINILSSEDIYESNLNIRNNNIGTTVTITSKPSVGINTGFGNNNIKETKIRNNNSNILSNNGNIKLTTNNKDINIISSNIKSKDTIDITSGNNLNVETKLDKEIKKGNGFNTSLTFGDESLGISLGYNDIDKDVSSINKRASIESENNKTNIKVNNEINLTASNVTINSITNTTKKLTIRDIQINNKDKQFNTSFGISTSAITQKDKTEHPKGTINLSYNYKNKQTDKLITKDKEIIQRETKLNSKLDGVVVDMRLLTKDGRSSIEDTALDAANTVIDTLDFLTPKPKEQLTAVAGTDILLESGMLIPTALLIKKGLNNLREKIQNRMEEKERGRGNNSHNNNNKEPDKDPNEDKVKELAEKKLESETKKKIVEQLEDEKTNKRTRDYLEELNRRLDKKEDKVKTKKSDNQINQDILRGNAPKEIDRVDTGYKGKDEPHIHVKDKAGDIIGIKKDGTLKHDGREGTKIEFSKEVWEYLLKNWFD